MVKRDNVDMNILRMLHSPSKTIYCMYTSISVQIISQYVRDVEVYVTIYIYIVTYGTIFMLCNEYPSQCPAICVFMCADRVCI